MFRRRKTRQWLIGFWVGHNDKNVGESIILAHKEPMDVDAIEEIEQMITQNLSDAFPYTNFTVKIFSIQRLPR